MIANLLDGVEVRLNTDYLENKAELDALADKVVYTGPIDAYFDYKLGTLEYRSVRFETETLDNVIWNKMYRTSLLKDNDMWFVPKARKGQDVIFNAECLQLTDKYFYIHIVML